MGDSPLIGGGFCHAVVTPGLFPREGRQLAAAELNVLWQLFQAIGRAWGDLHPAAQDASTLKSSWLEFIAAKTDTDPSYTAEYASAAMVVRELQEVYPDGDEALEKLFFDNGIPPGPPTTRLAHAKKYVVDEFIRVNVVASGFRSFGPAGGRGRNYKGYIGGSRYNLRARVRNYEPSGTGK